MPSELSFVIIILAIISIVIITLRGKIKANIGDKAIDIGGKEQDSKENPISIKAPSETTILVQSNKRSCGDCVLILIGEREKYELNFTKERDRILKTQMVFAEQKLIEIQTKLINGIQAEIRKFIKQNNGSSIDESIQYKLIYGLMKDVFIGLKDEFRRSFKENGFYKCTGSDFSAYIKNQVHKIISIMEVYVHNIYPEKKGLLEAQCLIKIFEDNILDISGILNDVYVYARDTKLETEDRIENLSVEFGKWVDTFIN